MSVTSICNQALTSLGATPIIEINEDTTEAKLCKLHYQTILESLLDAVSWTFATKRMELPYTGMGESAPYSHQFLIPVNVLRVLEANSDGNFNQQNNVYWQIEEEFILADTESLFIRAIINNPDTSSFTPSFTQALVVRLASAMALAITQSPSLEASKLKEAGNLIQIAATLDGTQGRTRELRSSKYLNVRRGGGGYFQSYDNNTGRLR